MQDNKNEKTEQLLEDGKVSESTQTRRIPTNLRLLQIVELLGRHGRAMRATDIAREIGLPKPTVHRLCKTLELEGFTVRDKIGSGISPARRLRTMSSELLFGSWDQIARHQVLVRVAASVKETVNFVVPTESGMRYVDWVETDWPFRIQLPVGSNVPFHCSASAKVYLASLPMPERRLFVRSLNLPKLALNTITDHEELLENLSEVRELGYAIDNEEFLHGMNAVAVPVKDHAGRYIASLAFHGPKQRITVDDAVSKVDVLFEGARALRDVILHKNL